MNIDKKQKEIKKVPTTAKATARKPKLRFSGFSGEWEEKKFSDLYDFGSTNSFSRDDLNYEKGRFYNIHYGDIHTKYKVLFDINNENVPFVNDSNNVNSNNDSILEKGDLVLADASEDYADIGKTLEIVNTDNKKVLSGLHTILVKPKKDELASGFMGPFLNSYNSRLKIQRIAQGVKVLGLSKKYLKNIELIVPKKEEQKKIAGFLGGVDEWIGALREEKEALLQYKKGMMQKLFPKKDKNIPELRFEGFSGEWEERRLGDCIKQSVKRNSKRNVNLILSVNNKKGFIVQTDQFNGHQVASKDLVNYKIVYKNEIAYNPSRINIGSIARLKDFEAGIVSPMYIVFSLRNDLSADFFDNLYQTYYFKHLIKIGCSGSVRESLNFKDLGRFKVMIPKVDEQKKIAEFLMSIDNLIDNKNKQITQAEEWKKGVMQGVFV